VADNGILIEFEGALKGAKANVVMLRSDGMSLMLDVGLGSNDVVRSFTLDTGASSMTVTSDIAAELVRTGHGEPNGNEIVSYAGGSTRQVPTITIDTVRVGKNVLHDVHASITPMGAPMLLGLDVLQRIGKFEVDAPHRTLTFNGGAS
jgi:clan AA aspartic protease (TIGR02281 family)